MSQSPDRLFHSLWASKSGDRLISCSSETSHDGFWRFKFEKGSVGPRDLIILSFFLQAGNHNGDLRRGHDTRWSRGNRRVSGFSGKDVQHHDDAARGKRKAENIPTRPNSSQSESLEIHRSTIPCSSKLSMDGFWGHLTEHFRIWKFITLSSLEAAKDGLWGSRYDY